MSPKRGTKEEELDTSYDNGIVDLDTSLDSGGYVIDMMDVTLAELSRPEGHLKGPDEESV